jgi:hypothetical protein
MSMMHPAAAAVAAVQQLAISIYFADPLLSHSLLLH